MRSLGAKMREMDAAYEEALLWIMQAVHCRKTDLSKQWPDENTFLVAHSARDRVGEAMSYEAPVCLPREGGCDMAHDNIASDMDGVSNDSKLTIPDMPRFEAFLAAARAASSLIPFAGGPIAEAVGYFGQRYIDKQQETFIEAVLRDLEEMRVGLDALNDSFFATFLRALEVARRTHERVKREALRNAVANAALDELVHDDNLQSTFLGYIEALTPWHIHLLQAIADPRTWAVERDYPVHDPNIDPVQMFEAIYRHQLPAHDFEKLLVQDLYNRGLATTGVDPYGPLYPRGQDDVKPRITQLGKLFLAFIASPVPEPTSE